METMEMTKLDAFREKLSKSGGVLQDDYREKAFKILDSIDFPTTKIEEWKYTRVGKIAKGDFSMSQSESISSEDNTNRVIQFINGNTGNCPDIEGVTIENIADANKELIGQNLALDNEAFHALNTAYATGGVCIRVHKNTNLDKPIHLEHIISQSQSMAAVRHVIVVEEGASARFVQTFKNNNAEKTLSLPVTEIFVGANAHCCIEKLQHEDATSFQVATEQVAQEKDSTFTIRSYTLNGALVRNNLNIEVNGENCTTNLNGAFITKEKQHVDNHTKVDHKVAHCESNELYKAVLDGKSTGVFNGKVLVRQDAQKINAFQSNGNVLLSDDATINSKPELEIYADDVKCSHGSTTGQLDEEALFYFRSRGLSKKTARELLIRAFVAEVFEQVENDFLDAQIKQILQDDFGWEMEL